MKHSLSKKIIALVLAAVSAFCLPLTLGATAATVASYPVIYVPDMTEITIFKNPNTLSQDEVYSVKSKKFLSAAAGIVAGLAAISEGDTPATGVTKVNNSIDAMLGDIACDAQGNSKNTKLGVNTYYNYLTYYSEDTEVYTENLTALIDYAETQGYSQENFFFFSYDWRLDPLTQALKLKNYIDKILSTENAKKVRLLSGGFGGIIANSYIYLYKSHATEVLASCVFLDTMMTGNSIIGDIMTGHIVYTVMDAINDPDNLFDINNIFGLIGIIKDAKAVLDGEDVAAAFARYLKQDPFGIVGNIFDSFLGDSLKTDLVTWFTLTLAFDIIGDEGMLNKVGKGYKELLIKAKDGLYSGKFAQILRNMPGIWAMVPVEEYEEAIKFMFGSRANVDKELLEKLDAYRNVINSTEMNLKALKLANINVAVVAGYGLQILPVTAHTNEQSDGFVATRYAGVGATTGDMNKDVRPVSQCANGNHNHLEPGKAVEASTCFLPENTWFIKGHGHMKYSSSTSAEFIFWLLSANTPRHVYTDPSRFPQYMQKAILGDKIYAYSVPSAAETRVLTYGDLNIDGKISAADARLALRYAVGLEGKPSMVMLILSDVDGSGKISAADARCILRYSVGLDAGFTVT